MEEKELVSGHKNEGSVLENKLVSTHLKNASYMRFAPPGLWHYLKW